MPTDLRGDLAAVMTARPVSQDKLEKLREKVREHRDLVNKVLSLEEEMKLLKDQVKEMETRELPDLFNEAGVDRVGLPEEGNYPAYDAVLSPFYHANIPAEQKPAAFEWLKSEGYGDLVKTTFKIQYGLRESEQAKKMEEVLDKLGIEYSSDMTVPWTTLTAWLKERIEKHDVKLPSLSLFGAVVEHIVRLKPRRK